MMEQFYKKPSEEELEEAFNFFDQGKIFSTFNKDFSGFFLIYSFIFA